MSDALLSSLGLGPLSIPKPDFYNCPNAGSLEAAAQTACNLALNAAWDLNVVRTSNRPSVPKYRKWFGLYSLSSYPKVLHTFAQIADAFRRNKISFYGNPADCSGGKTAFVRPDDPYKIYICDAFWYLKPTAQASALLRVMGQFALVSGTQDYAYGDDAGKALALSDPNKAINNADSYRLFVENTANDSMEAQPGTIHPISDDLPGLPVGFGGPFDAVLNGGRGRYAGKCYIFKGNQYIRFDWATKRVDSGYPRLISDGWPGLNGAFATSLDAAVNGAVAYGGKCYFFKGSQYVRYDWDADRADPGYPRPIAGNWPGLPSGFLGDFDAVLSGQIDADDECFFFKGTQYVPYNWQTDRAAAGGARPIADGWNNMPAGFTSQFSSAIDGIRDGFWHIAYFFKGTQFVRYDWLYDTAQNW